MKVPSPGAVVIGGHINGLGVVRSLAEQGITVAVITTRPFDIAHYSCRVCSHFPLPEFNDRQESLVELLEQRSATWSGWTVIPTNDESLEILAKHHDLLSRWYRIIAPPSEIANHVLDKKRTTRTAEDLGIDVPHCYGPSTDATAARTDIRYPVVVKPNIGHRFFSQFGCKLFIAHTRPELLACVKAFSETRLAGQIRDLVPGPDSQIYTYCTYMDARGEPRAGITVRKLRQNPPFFGVARVAEIVDDNDLLRDSTVEILRKIAYRGIAVAEFKLDPRDGTFRFLEVNGRSVIYNGLLRSAGVDLNRIAWSDYVLDRPEQGTTNSWRGVWINLQADLLYSTLFSRHERLHVSDYLAPYFRPKTFAVWSARDPVPYFRQWSWTALEAGQAFFRGRLGDMLRARIGHRPG